MKTISIMRTKKIDRRSEVRSQAARTNAKCPSAPSPHRRGGSDADFFPLVSHPSVMLAHTIHHGSVDADQDEEEDEKE
jgi:hypothetical protein